jgi:hypothetical protein
VEGCWESGAQQRQPGAAHQRSSVKGAANAVQKAGCHKVMSVVLQLLGLVARQLENSMCMQQLKMDTCVHA